MADPTGGWKKAGGFRWVAPVSGYYRITFTWEKDATALSVPGRVHINGVARMYSPNPPAVAYSGWSLSDRQHLSAGDQVSTQVNVAMTTQQTAQASTTTSSCRAAALLMQVPRA